jgi:cytochrome c oxidase cbb3-type subunit I/II
MWWHRGWERLPLKFTVLTTIAVLVASAFEIIPTFLIRSNVPTIATVKPYTPLELAGRDLYVGEGCYNCHSQMIRPILAETKRYGEYSKPGEFIYDHPFQWGSRRIGPDLAREGGRQSHLWHLMHLLEPTNTTPGSIMPAYAHLLDDKLNFKGIPARVQAAAYLGAPYDKELTDSEAIARAQAKQIADDIVKQGGRPGLADKQVVAMIAYLQRIGTDLFAPPLQAPAPPAAAPPEQPQTAGLEGAPNG